jgi:RNase P/RNase MRP subunit p30
MEVRSMHDVVNLATLFGMKEHAARNAMTTNVDVMLKLSKRRRDVDFSASEVTKMNVDG